MKDGRPKPFLQKSGLIGFLIFILAIGFYGYQVWAGMFQDVIWKRKVKRQINIEEARIWGLNASTLAESGTSGAEARLLLTNAPACLLKKNYKRNPDVMVGYECIHLRYGGGMYSWGLTIGATNLPSDRARGRVREVWAPGIYFWNQ